MLLLKPHKRIVQWAAVWTTLTVVAWGFHGDSLMDLARRAPYITTPLALLFLLYRNAEAQAGSPTAIGTRDRCARVRCAPTSSAGIGSSSQ